MLYVEYEDQQLSEEGSLYTVGEKVYLENKEGRRGKAGQNWEQQLCRQGTLTTREA